MTQPSSCQSCLIGSLVGWGMTESNFTSDGLKEVEVQPFLTFSFFWRIFTPSSSSKGKLWPFSFQVPIFGESECQANVEENGSNFAQGMLCAGGTNQKGSCPVNREANISKDQSIKLLRVTAEEP